MFSKASSDHLVFCSCSSTTRSSLCSKWLQSSSAVLVLVSFKPSWTLFLAVWSDVIVLVSGGGQSPCSSLLLAQKKMLRQESPLATLSSVGVTSCLLETPSASLLPGRCAFPKQSDYFRNLFSIQVPYNVIRRDVDSNRNENLQQ